MAAFARRTAWPVTMCTGATYEWVAEITLPVMINALDIKAIHGLSYWDAAIIAAARALGCRELLSEDMSHGREVEGVTINKPFR